MLAAHILLDIGREVVPCNTDRVIRHDAAQRNDGDFRGTSAYVHYHVALRSLHVDSDTDGCRHRLINQIHVPSPGMFSRIAHGTQFHLGRTGRNAYHHAQGRGKQAATRMHHLYQSAHQLFASIEISDDPFAQGTHRPDVVMRLFIHQLGFLPHGYHLVRAPVQRHHGRLVHHNLPVTGDNGIGRPQVHCYFLSKRKESHQPFTSF